MIRLATADDVATVQRISADAYQLHVPVLGLLIQPGIENYAPRIADGQVWLLEDGGTIAGLIVLERHPDHVLIFSIAVDPLHQGRSHASALLRHAEGKAREWDLPEMRLYTNALMTKNVAIYTRAGYRETSRQPSPNRPHHTQINMRKTMSDLLPERVEVLGVDHIYLAVSDFARTEAFYDTVLGILDYRKIDAPIGGAPHRHYFNKAMQISIRPSHGGKHDPYAPGLHHLCLQVADNAAVDTVARLLQAAGIEATAPAAYPQYADDYYATFFSDPDGLRHEIVARRVRRKMTVERWSELTSFLNPWAKLKT